MRVLTVDDSAVARAAVRHDLQTGGYQVIEVASGEEALKLLPGQWPDMVVLDVHLPGINGFEVCRRIRSLEAELRPDQPANLPVIFVTAIDTVAGRLEGFGAGAVDFIGKPFMPGRVREAADALLKPPRQHQAPAALLVDDSPLVRRICGDLLEQIGFRVDRATDGREALARLEATPDGYDLVVTDFIMPHMNGDALCAAIRKDPRLTHLPVLVMSGLDDTVNFKHLIEAGASDFIRKPFVKEVFVNRLATVLLHRPVGQQIAPHLARFFAQSGFRDALQRFDVPAQGHQAVAMLLHAGALRQKTAP